LCDLHYQCARLGVEGEKPLRVIQSTIALLQTGLRLGPGPHLVRAQSSYALFVAVLGLAKAADKHIARAEKLAREIEDRSSLALAVQNRAIILFWEGRMVEAIKVCHELVANHGLWLEVTEFILMAASARAAQAGQGRPRESLDWGLRGVDRVRRHGRIPEAFIRCVVPMLRTTLKVLDNEREADKLLAGLRTDAEGKPAGIFSISRSSSETSNPRRSTRGARISS
jgi:hypothetical protein